jgi:hypothetical protein
LGAVLRFSDSSFFLIVVGYSGEKQSPSTKGRGRLLSILDKSEKKEKERVDIKVLCGMMGRTKL